MSILKKFTSGRGIFLAALLQWQPALTAHDPNPPITLLDPAGGSQTFEYAATGGAVVSGTAAVAKVKVPAISGGAITGSTAAVSTVKVPEVSGGAITAGVANVAKVKAFAAAGEILISGSADYADVDSYAGDGGVDVSGSATTSYTAGQVSPPVIPPAGGHVVSLRTVDWPLPEAPVQVPVSVHSYLAGGGFGVVGEAGVQFVPVTIKSYAGQISIPVTGGALINVNASGMSLEEEEDLMVILGVL